MKPKYTQCLRRIAKKLAVCSWDDFHTAIKLNLSGYEKRIAGLLFLKKYEKTCLTKNLRSPISQGETYKCSIFLLLFLLV